MLVFFLGAAGALSIWALVTLFRVIGSNNAQPVERTYIAIVLQLVLVLDCVGWAMGFRGRWWLSALAGLGLCTVLVFLNQHRKVNWHDDEIWALVVFNCLAMSGPTRAWTPWAALGVVLVGWTVVKLRNQYRSVNRSGIPDS